MRRFQWTRRRSRSTGRYGPVPWSGVPLHAPGTVHIADSVEHMTEASGTSPRRRTGDAVPAGRPDDHDRPYPVAGRAPSRCGPTRTSRRSRAATRAEAASAATGTTTTRERFADRMQDRFESSPRASAPGSWPAAYSAPRAGGRNANLVGGAINGGTSQLHQELVFRPVPGWVGPRRRSPAVPGLGLGPPRWWCARGPRDRTPRAPRSRMPGSGGCTRAASSAASPADPATLAARTTPTRRLWRRKQRRPGDSADCEGRVSTAVVMIDHDRDGATRRRDRRPARAPVRPHRPQPRPPDAPGQQTVAPNAPGRRRFRRQTRGVDVVFVARRAGSGSVVESVLLTAGWLSPSWRFPRGYLSGPTT